MKKLLIAMGLSSLIALSPCYNLATDLSESKTSQTQENSLPVLEQDSAKSMPHPVNLKSKVIDYSKIAGTKLKNLFSYENQRMAVTAFFLIRFCSQFLNDFSPLKQIPPIITSTCDTMHYPINTSKIGISSGLGFNAVATTGGSITIGKKLIHTVSPQELSFVLGHEIAHVQKRHLLKLFFTSFGLRFALFSLQESLDDGINYLKEKYNLDNSTLLGKVLSAIKSINNSPLISAGLYLLLEGKISRYFEKEADLVSATTLNNAKDGVTFFKRAEQHAENKDSIFRLLNPFYLVHSINYIPGFCSHPSDQERISYLSELAAKQAKLFLG